MSAAPERVAAAQQPGNPRLLVRGLSKTFGRQRVLWDVDLVVKPGELHGLVGQNGSGKSTLVKILTGIHAADPGATLEVDGTPLGQRVSVATMRAVGLSVVHQTLGLIEDASVLENVRAGHFRGGRWLRRIDWRYERAQVVAVLERLGCTLDLRAPVATLSAEDRATVAIARALQDHQPGRGLIIFDESTRALTAHSLERFYEQINSVRRAGAAVLLISHRLEEVLSVTDRISVLRDGVITAAGARTEEMTEGELVRLMIGRQLTAARRRARPIPATVDRKPATARVLAASGEVARDVSFDVRSGEVVGLTGLVGSGFEELPYLLSGARSARSGTLLLADQRLELGGRARVTPFLDAGVALVPERRDHEGLALEETVLENLTLPRVRLRGNAAWTGRGWQHDELRTMVRRLGIRPDRGDVPAATLSGGNQQKVLLAKWLASGPRLLLLHEPTQGVDVGAHADIADAIRATAADGCAVILAGTDAQELASLCDRVLVFRDGQIHAELTGQLDQDSIISATFAGADVFAGASG
ncbi:MAG TPA: sugar ABC transporter ATP-binding protein [Solirubrobacteraceae bacterium]|nr:sugar ABC transporter ATP-binding protein [Solirubrobacteraceae bacterium]